MKETTMRDTTRIETLAEEIFFLTKSLKTTPAYDSPPNHLLGCSLMEMEDFPLPKTPGMRRTLYKAGLHTVANLVNLTFSQFYKMNGISQKQAFAVLSWLTRHGLTFKTLNSGVSRVACHVGVNDLSRLGKLLEEFSSLVDELRLDLTSSPHDLLDSKLLELEDFPLPKTPGISGVLATAGLLTVRDLTNVTFEEFFSLNLIGIKRACPVLCWLNENGLAFKP